MNYPEYAKIGNKKYKINTHFRTAIECNRIATDETIGDYERALAIIYTLYGEEGLDNPQDYEKLLKISRKYLSCGKEVENSKREPDMDFIQDMDYIEASFMSDFHIDLENSNMHWWKFITLMNGLSNSELGNCCVLNNVRNLRNMDLKDIKDEKQRKKIREAQQMVALKKKEKHFTEEQIASMERFNKLIGLRKE